MAGGHSWGPVLRGVGYGCTGDPRRAVDLFLSVFAHRGTVEGVFGALPVEVHWRPWQWSSEGVWYGSFNRVGRRVWWIPTHASPSSNRTGGFPASGSRRLFAGLLHERAYAVCCDDLPYSWLAGIGSAAGSELPLPFSGTVGVTIPFGPSPRSLSALDSSAQLPLLRSTPLSGASRLL